MKTKLVLIVDDSESDQFYVSELLAEFDEGIQVKSAYDGQEALDILTSIPNQPNVILLDLNMPGMTGFEFLEAYNQIDGQHSSVMVLSSSDQSIDRDKVNTFGFVKSFLVKPIEFSDLESLDSF